MGVGVRRIARGRGSCTGRSGLLHLHALLGPSSPCDRAIRVGRTEPPQGSGFRGGGAVAGREPRDRAPALGGIGLGAAGRDPADSAPAPAARCALATLEFAIVAHLVQPGLRRGRRRRRLGRLRVERPFKGAPEGSLTLDAGWGGGDCGFESRRDSYLVYASSRDDGLYTGICRPGLC